MYPMVTVQCWTGAETKALRQAMRLSVRAFAAYLGIDARSVNKWEARLGTITLRPAPQSIMNTALGRAPDDVKNNFAQTVSTREQEQGVNTALNVEPAHSLLRAEPEPSTLVPSARNDGNDSSSVTRWNHHSITFVAQRITGEDFSITRRGALVVGASAVFAGVALTEPLRQWLFPIGWDTEFMTGSSGFSLAELASLEGLVGKFRDWRIDGNRTLARKAVVAQLNDLTDHLREVSPSPASWRAFGVAAELSEVVASMSWDAGLHRCAQRYYVLSVQLAKLANDDGLAATVLAALARQCYDLGHSRDGFGDRAARTIR
ncbi:MAG: helix-turn-helix domain-containing protein, partial [Pseudonocardiaceae bacterium]